MNSANVANTRHTNGIQYGCRTRTTVDKNASMFTDALIQSMPMLVDIGRVFLRPLESHYLKINHESYTIYFVINIVG